MRLYRSVEEIMTMCCVKKNMGALMFIPDSSLMTPPPPPPPPRICTLEVIHL